MIPFTAHDATMMALAIRLAQKGQYTTSPNPNVGCVITDPQGNIIGQGWHQKAGSSHAEVNALQQAGGKAKGAIAYVTLEPCSH
ncbi:MAG: diaminohydroxyphosphoribosylaminopyrimidine deaminase, partial [Paraglaciecola sp.]